MSTNLAEFRRKVMLNIKSTDGLAELSFMEAINDAHKAIARVIDMDELMVLDTANASTVANTHRYHIANDWTLDRPKDIYSIRYMANEESRKLEYVPPREWDSKVPYPEGLSTGKPQWYTQKGMYVELLRIPDEAANLYVYHSQWPATLANDTDETPYLTIDDVITQLATEMTQAYLNGGSMTDWTKRAMTLLHEMTIDEEYHPDVQLVAKPFNPCGLRPWSANYVNDPFVKRSPR